MTLEDLLAELIMAHAEVQHYADIHDGLPDGLVRRLAVLNAAFEAYLEAQAET